MRDSIMPLARAIHQSIEYFSFVQYQLREATNY
jgi:hypothetical protein